MKRRQSSLELCRLHHCAKDQYFARKLGAIRPLLGHCRTHVATFGYFTIWRHFSFFEINGTPAPLYLGQHNCLLSPPAMRKSFTLEQRWQQLRQDQVALRALDSQVERHDAQENLLLQRSVNTPVRRASSPIHTPPSQARHRRRLSQHSIHPEPRAQVDVQPSNTSVHDDADIPEYAGRFSKQQLSTAPTSAQFADLMGKVGVLPDLPTFTLDEAPESRQTDDVIQSSRPIEGAPLQHQFTLSDPIASDMRRVIAMRFHSKLDNILLSAHSSRSDGKFGAAESTVAVWSLEQPRPALQRTLLASSPITALEHFPISPTFVVAGTSVGSILMWDLRVKTALPIHTFDDHTTDMRDFHDRRSITTLKTTAVASPVFLSTTASGHVCKWSLSDPTHPISQAVVLDPVRTVELAVHAADFPSSTRLSGHETKETNRPPSFFAGTLQGDVCRVETDKTSWSVDSARGQHDAPVTALSAHPSGSRVPYLDDALATASFDWTVNVWHFRRGQPCKRVWSFDNAANGVVYDVAWSTLHPTVLCCGDEAGVISLFDLSGHVVNAKTDSSEWRFMPPGKSSRDAITALQWSKNDRFICAGDAQGKISVWTATSSLATLPDAEWMGQFLKSKAARGES